MLNRCLKLYLYPWDTSLPVINNVKDQCWWAFYMWNIPNRQISCYYVEESDSKMETNIMQCQGASAMKINKIGKRTKKLQRYYLGQRDRERSSEGVILGKIKYVNNGGRTIWGTMTRKCEGFIKCRTCFISMLRSFSVRPTLLCYTACS